MLQICHEFERFSTYMPNVRVGNFFGGLPIKQQIEQLKSNTPHAVVGTPGRLKQVRNFLYDSALSAQRLLDAVQHDASLMMLFASDRGCPWLFKCALTCLSVLVLCHSPCCVMIAACKAGSAQSENHPPLHHRRV